MIASIDNISKNLDFEVSRLGFFIAWQIKEYVIFLRIFIFMLRDL